VLFRSPSVYDFLGGANRVPCRVRSGRILVGEQALTDLAAPDDENAQLYVRPHDLEILPPGASDGLPATIGRITLTGGTASVLARVAAGIDVEIELPRWSLETMGLAADQSVNLRPRRFGLFGSTAGAHPVAGLPVSRPALKPELELG
jgi:sulfate transport system ATP-binding protein